MLKRHILKTVTEQLKRSPSVVLLGPRQAGKTTLAKIIAKQSSKPSIYLDMERPTDKQRLNDAETFLRAQEGKLVIIDEIQRTPYLFEILRGIIDDLRSTKNKNGHFLLLGSASLDLLQQTSETLAGRISYAEMSTINALELPKNIKLPKNLWVRGGFPESLLQKNDAQSIAWRQDFIRSYLERDVPLFAPRLPSETIGRLWKMLAATQGSPLNQQQFSSSLSVSSPSIARYIDLLVDLLLIRRLRPWSNNNKKRLIHSPKIYLRDSGIAHALLDLQSWEDILGNPICGPSWEGFVIENLISIAKPQRTPYYYRTADGAEIDLLFEHGGKIETAIEIKLSASPTISKGFYLACQDLKPKQSFVVHGGTEEWPIDKNITAISLIGLMKRLAS